jgi:small subunit ribosomal protein S5
MTAKTSTPDRKRSDRRDRRQREPSEFAETTLSVDRVTRVVKGGRRMRFRAIVIVGNKKGKVGLGTGKANEVQVAVSKATKDARRRMIRIPLVKGTIPHEVEIKFKAAKLRLIPASEGTGVIAGGALRVILEHVGVRNILSKRYGTTNHLVNAQATLLALKKLHTTDRKGNAVGDPEPAPASAVVTPAEEPIEVRQVSRKDISQEGTLKGN